MVTRLLFSGWVIGATGGDLKNQKTSQFGKQEVQDAGEPRGFRHRGEDWRASSEEQLGQEKPEN